MAARSVGGLDPSASPRRPSGVAVIELEGRRLARVELLRGDPEIVAALEGVDALAVDSPLSIPAAGAFREVDLEMMRRGFRVLPPSWRGMSMLVERSTRLLRMIGAPAFETHPRSALAASGCRGVEELLGALGISHGALPGSRDALDAVIAAAVALEVVEGSATEVRAPDGSIYLIPGVCRTPARASRRRRRTASWRPGPPATSDPWPPP